MMSRFLFGAKSIGVPVALMFLIVGCAGEGDGYSGARGEVTGKVTFEGKPIPEGCKVLFQSNSGKNTYTAFGVVNAAGEYVLNYNGTPNLPALTYQVQLFPPIKASP